ncbi:MAG: cadherin domain protein [Planctomycetaceae bacterium]|nr:cadherin domain protein [Planctomycetaceae bacterium]
MSTSWFAGSSFDNSWNRLWQRITQQRKASKARRQLTLRQVSTKYVELLETRVLLTDFGDAPVPYPTLIAENGAQHAEVGLTLGATRDGEANGIHSVGATGDDTAGSDDEDGVTFPATIRVGDLGVQITVNVQGITTTGQLDAWIDFNGDGSWGGPGEQIANNVTLVNGNNTLTIDIPAYSLPGTTYARFRLSTAGNLGVRGAASDGEVEDYAVTIANPIVSTGVFAAPLDVTLGADGADSVFAADIDGDGDMDLLSASVNDDKIAWYENDGTPLNGGWANHPISLAANAAEAVYAIDLDGDGDMDVISASRYDDKLAWYENDGTPAVGAWTEHSISTAVNGANSLSSADIDGDGDIDVLATAAYGSSVYWFENNGSQAFTLHLVTSAASEAISVTAADIDHDGDMDIISASNGDDKVNWYENNGGQSFTTRSISTLSNGPQSVFVADIDRDGDQDVAVVSFSDNQLAWYENDGTPANGTWPAHSVTTTLGGPTFVSGGDLDGDSDIDLIVACTDGKVVLFKNNGTGTFTSSVITSAAPSAQSVVAADMDQDGDLDVAAASLTTDKIAWYENTNDTTPPSTTSFALNTPATSPTNATTLKFRVTFSEAVQNVDAADFAAVGTTATISVATVSPSVYDVTLANGNLASLNGTVGLNFAASPTITDLFSNPLPSTEPAIDQTYMVDHTAPSTTSFVRLTPAGTPTNADTLIFQVTFSDPVTGVALADFAASGTTATIAVAAVSTSVYNVTLSGGNLAALNGTVGLNFAASPTINDLAGNALPNTEPATDQTYAVDNATPSVTSFVLLTPASSPTNADSLTFRATFSEGVSGVDLADFAASGTTATISVASVSASVYDITLTGGNLASLNATVGLNLSASAAITDLAGNTLPKVEPVTDQRYVVDNNAPTLVITPNGTTTNANQTVFTFQFSETVTGFDASDITANNGTKGLFAVVDGDTYTLVVASVADGQIDVSVGANAGSDAAANGSGSASTSITIDRTASSLTITPNGTLNSGSLISFTFQFTSTVAGFTASDISITNGTKGAFTPIDGDTYVLVVAPVADGVVGIDVPAGVAFDVASNGNTAASASVISDRTVPTLTISPNGTQSNAGTITFTFQFSETVTGFGANDVTLTNGTKGAFTAVDGETYTLLVTPVADGTVSASVDADAAADLAGNINPAASASVTIDRLAPTLTITPNGTITNLASTTFTFQFSEAVTGFSIDDVTLTNGTKGTFTAVDGDTYQLDVTPIADGAVIVSVGANAASDGATNGSQAATATVTSDRTLPSLEISPSGLTTNVITTTFTFQFSEDVSGFDAGDITVTNGTKGTFTVVDAKTYTLIVAAVADGPVSVTVNAGVANDAAGNLNTGATASIASDRTAPELTISPDGTLTNAGLITFTFQFSEPVVGFEAGDIQVTNGTAGTFTIVDADTYTLAVTPTADGDVTVNVTATTASDLSANTNNAATASVTSDRTAPSFSTPTAVGVAENQTAVLSVNASDAHGPVVYAIAGGADSSKFLIDATTGALTFVAAPDFENPADADLNNVYDVQVSAADTLNQTTVQILAVTVTAVNDNAPQFASGATFQIAENSTAVGTVSATDADQPTQTVSFTISGGADAALFAITSGGALSFKAAPDFETPADAGGNNVCELQVTADDGHGLTATQSLTVIVTDTAEAPQIVLDGLGVTWTKARPVHAINVLPGVIVVGNGSLAGGTLLISMNAIGSKKKSKDVLTIPSFAAIGQSSGLVYANAQLNMHIDLNEQVTAASVQAFLRGITFLTKGKGLKIPTRNLHITLSKSDGLTGTATQVIQVHKKAVVG